MDASRGASPVDRSDPHVLALATARTRCHELARDLLVAVAPETVLWVAQGSLAIGVFAADKLARSLAESTAYAQRIATGDRSLSLLAPTPLQRIATKTVALFEAGAFLNPRALSSAGLDECRIYTTAPSTVWEISNAQLATAAAREPSLQRWIDDQLEQQRRQLANMSGVSQAVLDFFVRNGVAVAGPSVRVRQLDRCIECKLCEQACEKRFGAQRLTLGGYTLGLVDFVYACRTCSDQRCIDPCEHDAISFDTERSEVLIAEDRCIGCSLCAEACPYQSIEMINIDHAADPSYSAKFRKRLVAKRAIPATHDAPRGEVRRIANKCDHCADYPEQACISACPTGALIDAAPSQLFSARTLPADSSSTALVGTVDGLNTEPFTAGLSQKEGGRARLVRRRVSQISWFLGAGVWLLFLAEIALRTFAPELSLEYWHQIASGLTPDLALMNVDYLAGSELALYCGYIGTLLMIVSLIYVLQRRLGWLSRVARNKYWLDLHILGGTLGPLYIVLHTALRLDNWVAIPFWAMLVVVLSGFYGRFMFIHLNTGLVAAHELLLLDSRASLAGLRVSYPEAIAEVLHSCEARIQAVRETVAHRSLLALVVSSYLDRVRRILWRRRLRRSLESQSIAAATREEIVQAAEEISSREILRELVPRIQPLIRAWKWLHVGFTLVLVVGTIVHIWSVLSYAV